MKDWSNLATVVYKRTYARKDNGNLENWEDTVKRVIKGNVRGFNVSEKEISQLEYLLLNRKASPAGRGLWFSGSPGHDKMGGVALNNCWGVTADDWQNFVLTQDLLMLGGGVGVSVEHRFVSKLPRIKKDVKIIHKATKDATFIVPDSRTGWCELARRVYESFFVTGQSFDYSTVCVRGYGEPILGFGGTSSGPLPLIAFIDKLQSIFQSRQGKHLRPIDVADVICAIGEMVVSGNVRRSAILILGDAWDKDYLKAKRWDLGTIPTQRAMANFSVVCDDVEDLHPLFWKTYEQGEAFGIVNRNNIQKYGRMGELFKDSAMLVNPCVDGETEILTRNGYQRIDELVGQETDVWNGFEWSKVTPEITGENQLILSVTFSDGRILNCTPYHKFIISTDYHGSTDKIEAKDLQSGMKIAKYNFPIIEHGENCDFAYMQGFISAEGMDNYKFLYLCKPKFVCENRMKPYIKHISAENNNDRKRVMFNFTPFAKNMVPFSWNIKSKLEWLAGLFDGDGCELKEGGLQLVSVDLNFLVNLQKMLSTLGIQSKIVPGQSAGYRSLPDGHGGKKDFLCQESRRICVGAVQMQQLKSLGLKCERMSFNKKPNRDASQFTTVVDVTENGVTDKVYCFNEPKKHLGCFNGIVTAQCGEATLENAEPCNLQEICLPNIVDKEEFALAARLMHRWGKRVTCEKYHQEQCDEVVKRNRRVGTGITGCLESPLFTPEILDYVYAQIQEENVSYSNELNIPQSIRTTVIKPSGTMSKLLDCAGEGLHGGWSRYLIQRIRFAANDNLIPLLREAGHHIEPVVKFDGSLDHNTVVVDFYVESPQSLPVTDEGWDTWKQLETLKMAQKHWADQSVSVTVYYKKEEISMIKEWLSKNLKELKTISFLCHNEHGFKQAPKETISKEQFEKLIKTIKPINANNVQGDNELDSMDCISGSCPIK